MTQKLTKYSLEYHMIIYYIWQLVDYYSVLFNVDTSQAPSEIITKLMQAEGISYIRFSFPKAERKSYGALVRHMKQVYNQYLRYVLLPQQRILKPFCADADDIYGMLEALYVNLVFEDDGYIYLDVIYVDNYDAYNHVRNDEILTYRKDGNYYAETFTHDI